MAAQAFTHSAAPPNTAARAAARANFASSRLLRLLDAAMAGAREPDVSRQDFAERLAQWLSAADTVRLHAALPPGPVATLSSAVPPGASAWLTRTQGELDQLRDALTKGVAAQAAQALRDAPHELDAGHAPHRKRHLDQQAQMALKIAALRARLRQVLSQTSPRLHQLAVLDAVLEHSLSVREQKWMAAVPLLFERRFEQLRQARPDDWHSAFVTDMQELLLAELELRLQPLMGLMHALRGEIEKHTR